MSVVVTRAESDWRRASAHSATRTRRWRGHGKADRTGECSCPPSVASAQTIPTRSANSYFIVDHPENGLKYWVAILEVVVGRECDGNIRRDPQSRIARPREGPS